MLRRGDEARFTSHAKNRQNVNTIELNADRKKELKDAFDLFDSEQTGKIDFHELKVALRGLGYKVSKNEVLQLAKDADPEDSGKIDFSEFLDIVSRKMKGQDPDEEIRKAFTLFDDDRTGKISLKNMIRVSKELGENLSEEELQAMIDEFDGDQDGEISVSEFFAIMKQSSVY